MIEIGKLERMQIVEMANHGVYLNGMDLGDILLPKRYVPKDYEVGDWLEVFTYFDSEDRLIATTEAPVAMVGDFVCLECVATNRVGAFMDWGLPKDLLVPFREQSRKMFQGRNYIVHVYYDKTSNRIAASSKLDKFMGNKELLAQEGDEVELLLADETDLGYKAIINNTCWGVLYKNEVFETIHYGQKVKGYIKRIRPDGKIDLSLHKSSMDQRDEAMVKILDLLEKNDGFLDVTDKCPPEKIYKMFGISKKLYKKTVGNLYKEGTILIHPDGLRLNKPGQM